MDAGYIASQMDLSPIWGDPDEDREFTAADLEPEPQKHAGPADEARPAA